MYFFWNCTFILPSLLFQIIVAVEKKELPQLEKLYQRGLENGVKDLKILDSKQIKEVEPYCEVRLFPDPFSAELKIFDL